MLVFAVCKADLRRIAAWEGDTCELRIEQCETNNPCDTVRPSADGTVIICPTCNEHFLSFRRTGSAVLVKMAKPIASVRADTT